MVNLPHDISFRKKSFGKLAKDYQKYRRPYSPLIYKRFFSLLKDSGDKIRILDLGCGTGLSTEPLLTLAPNKFRNRLEMVGCDHDSLMLKYARKSAKTKKLPITYIEGKAEKLPFKSGYFDAVIAGTSFHWFATRKAFSQISRVMKPGAVFMAFWKGPTIIKHNGKIVEQDIYERYRCTSVTKMWRNIDNTKRLFNSAGFKHFQSFKLYQKQRDTVDELLGGQRTLSKYAMLSASDKRKFLSELRVAYKAALGHKKYFVSKRENIGCRAFK